MMVNFGLGDYSFNFFFILFSIFQIIYNAYASLL